jgi:hypothetical protein
MQLKYPYIVEKVNIIIITRYQVPEGTGRIQSFFRNNNIDLKNRVLQLEEAASPLILDSNLQ